MNLMEHEVMAAPIGAAAAGDKPIRLVDYEDVKTCIDYALKFGYSLQDFREEVDTWEDFVLMTDTDTISRQAAIDAVGVNTWAGARIMQLPPAQPEIIDGRLFVTVDDIKKVNCVLVDEHKSKFCRQFWMDGDGPAPCEDAVSRLGAISHFRGIADATNPKENYNEGFIDGLEFCIAHLSTMPPVTLKQRTGKWIKRHWHGENTRECSACHVTQSVNVFEGDVMYKYCPYCGSKMDQ